MSPIFFFRRNRKLSQNHKVYERTPSEVRSEEDNFSLELFQSVDKNVQNIKQMMDSPSDLITKIFTIGENQHKCAIICIDGMVNKDLIQERILKTLLITSHNLPLANNGSELLDQLKNEILPVDDMKKVATLDDVSLAILSGDTALFVDGTEEVLILATKGWDARSVDEPISESVIRGPRDGFTENIRTNTTQIRRRIRDPNLRIDNMKVGRRSKTDIALIYIKGITNPEIVNEVKRRINSINVDLVVESGYIEQWIQDSFLSPFPQLQNTERPDKVVGALLQGNTVILVDGTPFSLIAPTTFGMLLQSPEDYNERWQIVSLLRSLRYLAAFLALFLPSIYIAAVSYHPGMIPSRLAFYIAGSRDGVPFPAVVEALIMEVTFEILREAGVRLPKTIGQAIGIVGGLVIGEAAVSAGIVSPIMVIVVAVTAISSFTLPSYSVAITFRMLRFLLMIAAAIFGLYGVILGYIMINIHLANLKSFGVPYTAPFAPSFYNDWKDLVIRAPYTMMRQRPQSFQAEDMTNKSTEKEVKKK